MSIVDDVINEALKRIEKGIRECEDIDRNYTLPIPHEIQARLKYFKDHTGTGKYSTQAMMDANERKFQLMSQRTELINFQNEMEIRRKRTGGNW